MGTHPAIATPSVAPATVRKLKLRLIPFLFLLYVIAFVDRINIGFAALTMNKELAITGRQFGFAAGIFFFGYFLFEVPSNLLLHRIGARVWIARILLTWGVAAIFSGFVRSAHQLYAVRFLLGLAEAGYVPGIVLYLTYWFGAKERAGAMALFLTGMPITNIVGAPISGLILDHVHWFGFSSWRWLFVLEGVPALVCGFLTYYVLPNRPEDARFLSESERRSIRTELQREDRAKPEHRPLSVPQAMTNGRVLYLAVTYFGMMIGLYTLSFWTPLLLQSALAGASSSAIGTLLIIPYGLGLLAMILNSRHSDRTLERRYHAAIPALVAGSALVLMVVARSPLVLVTLLSLLAVGICGFISPFWTLPNEFLTGFSAAAGIALINSIGNLGGFAGPYAIGAVNSFTHNIRLSIAVAGIPLLVSSAMLMLLPKRVR